MRKSCFEGIYVDDRKIVRVEYNPVIADLTKIREVRLSDNWRRGRDVLAAPASRDCFVTPTFSSQARCVSANPRSFRFADLALSGSHSTLYVFKISSLREEVLKTRRGRDSNPGSRLRGILLFESSSFDHSDTSPRSVILRDSFPLKFGK